MYFIGYQIKLPTKRVRDISSYLEIYDEEVEAFKGALF